MFAGCSPLESQRSRRQLHQNLRPSPEATHLPPQRQYASPKTQ